ncbi:hypothetical protein AVEN_66602-1 [Araneus ventricosus]|uniref:MATH domain-containing protein n=1 Tax=Araneus ventricosus TaxID=182803 RepID=A0A4Y2M498_ARAVE|nr:hypothetical protein AVEN_66602-1 [Araneus ventricosus]
MAASSSSNMGEVQRLVIDKKETLTGHDVIYSFAVHRLVTKETWSFALDYNTGCIIVPTSWSFGIFYEKVPETSELSCSITLKRTDNRENSVMVFALVSFSDVNGRVARFSEAVCSGTMFAGDEKQGSISNRDKSELFNQELIVRISISIQECHVIKEL